ncbi:MAG: hypothetical protein OXG98_19200 [Gemmatimonadetes bacterium]|nr:hypothetical protein [Gemmatimonadota bacterium]
MARIIEESRCSVQGGLSHKSRYVGFRYHDHMDFGYGSRMVERQDQIVFMYPFHINPS